MEGAGGGFGLDDLVATLGGASTSKLELVGVVTVVGLVTFNSVVDFKGVDGGVKLCPSDGPSVDPCGEAKSGLVVVDVGLEFGARIGLGLSS